MVTGWFKGTVFRRITDWHWTEDASGRVVLALCGYESDKLRDGEGQVVGLFLRQDHPIRTAPRPVCRECLKLVKNLEMEGKNGSKAQEISSGVTNGVGADLRLSPDNRGALAGQTHDLTGGQEVAKREPNAVV